MSRAGRLRPRISFKGTRERERELSYPAHMSHMSISEVARQVGIRASAIRYYEQIGILEPAQRVSGQRRYDRTVLYRLALIQRAQQTGFSLDEIRQLFFGFQNGTPVSQRWRKLSGKKLVELKTKAQEIERMRQLLLRIQRCRCHQLEQCGKAIFEHQCHKEAE